MGVDANLYIKADISADNIIDAIGRILGLEPRRFGDKGEYWTYNGVIEYEPSEDIVGYARLSIPEGKYKGAGLWPSIMFNSYYQEFKDGEFTDRMVRGFTRIHFSSSPLRVAILRRLAETFGGVLQPHDSEGTLITYKRPRKNFWAQRDDETYEEYHQYLWNIPPVTDEDIEAAREVAAYNDYEFTPASDPKKVEAAIIRDELQANSRLKYVKEQRATKPDNYQVDEIKRLEARLNVLNELRGKLGSWDQYWFN